VHAPLLGLGERRGATLRQATAAVIDRLSGTRTPQGAVAVVRIPVTTLDAVLSARPRLVAVLVGVSDPGNAGTVIRSADAAGADAVVLTAGSTDPWAGKVIRASAGSVFDLPVVTGEPPATLLPALRAAHLTVRATAVDGDEDLDRLIDAGALAGATAWVFGEEAAGLDAQTLAMADQRVRIPLRGKAESLNLAAAVAVCLFASSRAHRSGRPDPADSAPESG
jgi:TrmH family RNA methyltransferase